MKNEIQSRPLPMPESLHLTHIDHVINSFLVSSRGLILKKGLISYIWVYWW